MKNFLIIAIISINLLTGCSIEIDTHASDGFANAAEELGNTFSNVKTKLESLQKKQYLTTDEQKAIVQQVNTLTNVINHFKEEGVSFLGNMPMSIAVNELDKKEEILLSIKEKAEKGKATVDDVKKLIKTISDDYEFNLFK